VLLLFHALTFFVWLLHIVFFIESMNNEWNLICLCLITEKRTTYLQICDKLRMLRVKYGNKYRQPDITA